MDIEELREYWDENKEYDDRIGDYKINIKNYSTLCKILNEPVKEGNSRKYQIREWERYFDYYKAGVMFIITEIYEEPLPQQKGEYINPIDLLNEYEMYKILKANSNKVYDFNLMELAENLGYINNNYRYYKNKQNQLTSKIFQISYTKETQKEFIKKHKIINDLYMWIEARYKYRLKKMLHKLESTGMVVINTYYIGLKGYIGNEEEIEIKDEYGDVIETGIFNPYIIPTKIRLTKDEETQYLEIKAEETQKYELNGKPVIEPNNLKKLGFNFETNQSYYQDWEKTVQKRVKEELGYDKVFQRYELTTSKLFINSKFKELDYQIQRKGINKRFYENLIKAKENNKKRLIEVIKREKSIIEEEGFDELSEIEKMIKLVQGTDQKELKKREIIEHICKEENCKDKEKAVNIRYRTEKKAIEAVVPINAKDKEKETK